ncbi:MAG: LanC-like protein [Actinomycetota bacterium]|nr:LanC-like protein [Actinomycetota bacterium]
MLYRPEAFEQLTEEPWHADRVGDAIRSIVVDADEAFDPDDFWPADEWDGWRTPLPLKTLYVGAAGVIWSLDALRRREHAESRLDLAAAGRRVLERWRETPDYMAGIELPEPAAAGLLSGQSGILTVAWRLEPSAEVADELLARVRENVSNDANELMWGAPGTMVAARAMLDWTGDERWADAWRDSAEELWRRREPDGLWTQRLYGDSYRGLGPAHGVVGNVLALLQGRELLAHEWHAALVTETAAVLARAAVLEDGLANWPLRAGSDLADEDGQIRLQWCAGAPGIVVSAASYLDEELLRAGAELTWRAGPPGAEKGSSICHGTAGSGYAFLKAFERTGDERWLERARRFAVHALGQVERARAERGHGRYSLWTGDVGVALFAGDCIDGRSAYPVLDSFD